MRQDFALLRLSPFFRLVQSATFAVLLVATPLAANAAETVQKPVNLTCDSLVTPIGLDTQQPQLSWQLQDSRYGAKQTAYQV